MATEADVVKKSGSFYSFGETRLGQGRENAKAFLRAHDDIFAEIARLIRAIRRGHPAVDAASPAGAGRPQDGKAS